MSDDLIYKMAENSPTSLPKLIDTKRQKIGVVGIKKQLAKLAKTNSRISSLLQRSLSDFLNYLKYLPKKDLIIQYVCNPIT